MRDVDTYEVISDGKTIWINDHSGLIGRFSHLGIDVHVDGHCKGDSCIGGPISSAQRAEAWAAFKAKMLELHDVEVADEDQPVW